MPAQSKAQQQIFGMALAVRKGELKKSEVNSEVLSIVKSDMTNSEIEDFAKTSHKGLPEYVKESLGFNEYFVVVKPGFENLLQKVIKKYTDIGLRLVKIRPKQLLMNEARGLYYVHKDEDFYYDLCKYMSSGVSIGLGFTSDKPIYIEDMLKIKDEIREKYGESDMRNVVHSSDSWKALKKESSYYF